MSTSRGELALLEWLRARSRTDPQRVPIGVGDDMAAVRLGREVVLIGADMVLDGVHFDSRSQPIELIGRKAVACSLSDCAAMAIVPMAAVVSVALPQQWSMGQAEALLAGASELARQFDAPVVGGDITSWAHPLAVDVAVVGRLEGGREPIRRSGGRVGDRIYVTGRLGGSLASGRHLRFTPRVREALLLAGRLGSALHAMIDVSDGLAMDVDRVCRASGCGAELEAEALVSVASEAARSGDKPVLEHVLHDGEDFELLLWASGPVEDVALDCGLSCVGRVVESGLWLRHGDGRVEPIEPAGYEHFR